MCTCASCTPTDELRDAGFAAWPTGNPAGRKSASDYAQHVKYGQQWGKGRFPVLPAGIWHMSPFPCTGTHHGDPGAFRKYPGTWDHVARKSRPMPDTTAGYVAAFVALNGYVTAARVAERAQDRAQVEREEKANAKRYGKITSIKPASRMIQLARDLRQQAKQERRAA